MNTEKMKALVLNDYATGILSLETVDIPQVINGHVLVKIAVSGTNPIDYKIRTGQAPYAMPELPAIIGTDMAGTIVAVANDVATDVQKYVIAEQYVQFDTYFFAAPSKWLAVNADRFGCYSVAFPVRLAPVATINAVRFDRPDEKVLPVRKQATTLG